MRISYRFQQPFLGVRFGSAVYKSIFLIANYFRVNFFIGIRFISRHLTSICYVDRLGKLTKNKISLLGSAPNEPTIKGLDSIDNGYRRRTTETSAKTMEQYPDIMSHEFALCAHVTLRCYTQIRIKELAKISGFFQTEPKNPC